ncbi:MAG: MCE family protein [Deltaproteobacteria bacterium]|nr:MCE family protein [Deltaproteobacteria bacterium]
MQISFDVKEKIVGAFLVGVVILLLTIVVMIGRGKDWFRSYVTYYTVFDQAYNLNENARVTLFKADIGKVRNVKLEGNKVRVELGILQHYAQRIRMDSVATVESPTLIGSEYVSITPGSPDAPAIPKDGTIPSKEKKDLMAQLQVEKTTELIVKTIERISEIVEHVADPKGPLYASLDSTEKALANIEAITQGIREGKGTAGSIIRSEELLQTVYEQLNQLDTILQNIEDATAKTPEIMNDVKQSMIMINQILTNIEKGSKDVPAVTQTTKEGIREVRDGVEEVDKVVQSIQKSFLIRPNLPPEPESKDIDTGLRR